MDPREMAIAAREAVELRLLADPENAERQKTHEIGDEARQKLDQSAPQAELVCNRPTRRYAQVQDEQRHRNGEEPIAQGGQSFHTLARDKVVNRAHWSSPRSQSDRWRTIG